MLIALLAKVNFGKIQWMEPKKKKLMNITAPRKMYVIDTKNCDRRNQLWIGELEVTVLDSFLLLGNTETNWEFERFWWSYWTTDVEERQFLPRSNDPEVALRNDINLEMVWSYITCGHLAAPTGAVALLYLTILFIDRSA